MPLEEPLVDAEQQDMTRTLDLGELHGTVIIFGGPYSNLQATQAIFEYCQSEGIPNTNIICTGDLVAYCAQANETSALIREWGIHVVQGNCEYALGFDEESCGCGFDQGSACDLASKQWFSYSRTQVSEDQKRWMRALPQHLRFRYLNKNYICLHGSANAQNEFIFQSSSPNDKLEQTKALRADVIIGGHCGLPFGQAIDSAIEHKYWLNAGVIGMPANDGCASTWFMQLNPSTSNSTSIIKPELAQVSWRRLSYDHLSTIDMMTKAGLSTSPYLSSLKTGLWPKLDILPEPEKHASGKPLSLQALLIE